MARSKKSSEGPDESEVTLFGPFTMRDVEPISKICKKKNVSFEMRPDKELLAQAENELKLAPPTRYLNVSIFDPSFIYLAVWDATKRDLEDLNDELVKAGYLAGT